jgi:hypothetical protein
MDKVTEIPKVSGPTVWDKINHFYLGLTDPHVNQCLVDQYLGMAVNNTGSDKFNLTTFKYLARTFRKQWPWFYRGWLVRNWPGFLSLKSLLARSLKNKKAHQDAWWNSQKFRLR